MDTLEGAVKAVPWIWAPGRSPHRGPVEEAPEGELKGGWRECPGVGPLLGIPLEGFPLRGSPGDVSLERVPWG